MVIGKTDDKRSLLLNGLQSNGDSAVCPRTDRVLGNWGSYGGNVISTLPVRFFVNFHLRLANPLGLCPL